MIKTLHPLITKLIKFCQFSYIHLKYIHPECTCHCLFRPIADFLTVPMYSQHGHKKIRFVVQKDHATPLLKTLPCLLIMHRFFTFISSFHSPLDLAHTHLSCTSPISASH